MFLLLFLLFSSLIITDQVPKSRKSILKDEDGAVMPPGVLATIDFNFDFLIECLGNDNNSGNNSTYSF